MDGSGLAVSDTGQTGDVATPQRTRIRDRVRLETTALALLGVVLALIVVADGSPASRLARLALVAAATGGAIALERRDGRGSAVVLLAAAALGVAIGVSFGIRHLTVDGVSATALVGLLALVDATMLLVLGVQRMLVGLRHGRAVVTGVGAVLVVSFVAWTLTPPLLATNVPPIEPGSLDPSDVGLDAEGVRFAAGDGTRLFGWFVPSENGAAVVVRHGAGSTASTTLPHAAVLVEHGYGVLVTDARGHGRSEGRAMDFGWFGDDDIEGAVAFLAEQPDVDRDRIAVLGLSMGGEESLGALATDAPIAAAIAEGVTARTDADKAWLSDAYGVRGTLQRGLEWLQYGLTDLLTAASKPTPLADAVAYAAPRPVLLITAGEIADEGHAARYLAEESPGNVTVWTVEGAGHTDALDVAPEEWERRVRDFLTAAGV